MGGTEGGLGSTGVWGVPTIYIYIYKRNIYYIYKRRPGSCPLGFPMGFGEVDLKF